MTFQPPHIGLTFTTEHIERAQKNRERDPLQMIWTHLLEAQPGNDMALTQYNGLRYRFAEDNAAGEQAVTRLLQGPDWPLTGRYFEDLATTFALAQAFEMVRDHPAAADGLATWLATFQERVDSLNPHPVDANPVEQIWLGMVNIAAGIVLDNNSLFSKGVIHYRDIIDNDIHPDGYIKSAVHAKDDQTYLRQVLSTGALSLSAEMAAHAGVDLWNYDNRGVSLVTAITYLLYYYYYPDKWRWNKGLTEEDTYGIFVQYGAFMEIANTRTVLRGVDEMLNQQRPLFNVAGGSLTSLTHSIPRKRGLFG